MKRFYNLEPVNIKDSNGVEVEGYYKAIPKNLDNFLCIFSTYKDNAIHINETTANNYENYYYSNIDHYLNEICGYVTGGAKGVIFKFNRDWFLYDKLPDIDLYTTFGLDFGGSGGEQTDEPDGSSKTVLGKIMINKSTMSIYVQSIVYKGYISSVELSKICKQQTIIHEIKEGGEVKTTRYNILADNARKDKIQDLLNDGLQVIGAKTKEGGSNIVVTGYDILKKYKIYVHKDDIVAQTELNNHKWAYSTITKEPTGQPEDRFKDWLDMLRYAVVNYDLYNW